MIAEEGDFSLGTSAVLYSIPNVVAIPVAVGWNKLADRSAGAEIWFAAAGQLVQVSKQRQDGWTYGSVLHDTVPDRDSIPFSAEGISSSAGWFRTDATERALPEQLKELSDAMGSDLSGAM